MGATIAFELIARENIAVEKALLDAAIIIEIGLIALPFQWSCIIGINRIKREKSMPHFLLNKIMEKDNNSVIEMIYLHITKRPFRTLANIFITTRYLRL